MSDNTAPPPRPADAPQDDGLQKLKTLLTYITRCGYCGHEETYVMRDTNANTGISDSYAVQMATQYVGMKEAHYCEYCKMITERTRVAYDLPDAESNDDDRRSTHLEPKQPEGAERE